MACWHKFEPRYDLGPANLAGLESVKGPRVVAFMETLRTKTYVQDVCIKCGAVVKRGMTNDKGSAD